MTQAAKNKLDWFLKIIVSACLIGGFVWAVARFLVPLADVPQDLRTMRTEVSQDVNSVKNDVESIARVQAIQTEALKTLAEVAKETADVRNDFERASGEFHTKDRQHDYELDRVRNRLEKLEQRPQ